MSSGSVTHWIDLFRNGDDEAASRLWNRYFAPLVSVARRKLNGMPGNALDAEDIALSAFHALYRAASAERLPEMSDREGLWHSLLVITAGKVVDAKRRELALKRGGGQVVQPSIDLADFLHGDEPDPTIAAMMREQFEWLLDLLQERELKEIAVLKMEGLTNEEIAARLQCSDRTVKRRLTLIRRIWEDSGVSPSS